MMAEARLAIRGSEESTTSCAMSIAPSWCRIMYSAKSRSNWARCWRRLVELGRGQHAGHAMAAVRGHGLVCIVTGTPHSSSQALI
jgi:hypothetical protein